ncbi:hypothetical protein [Paenibacillus alvei]|uniref:hypothetical protein n=1 Tax=Paenibacillus alvei TaxID=44250 RepID=UPI0022807FB7|nr:hypothetical protein [Paenibacillus alvei]
MLIADSLKGKVKGIIGPIFTDFVELLYWGSAIAAITFLIIAFIKLKGAQEQSERRDIIKWMRIIIFAYFGLNLVSWFISDYLSDKNVGNNPTPNDGKKTTRIEQQGEYSWSKHV